MPEIILNDQEVNKRAPQFYKYLNPLLVDQTVPFKQIPLYRSIFLIAGKKVSGDFASARFATFSKNIRGIYYEEWRPKDINKQDKWLLIKSYLNLYLIERTNHQEKEYICLHTDPTDPSPYKQVFHLHIKAAEHPIPKSHISLGLLYLNNIFETIEEYNKNLTSGIKLICDEVLSKL